MGMREYFGTGPKKLPTAYLPKTLVDNAVNDLKRGKRGGGITTVLETIRASEPTPEVIEHRPVPEPKPYHETPADIARIWLQLTYGESMEMDKELTEIAHANEDQPMAKWLQIWAKQRQGSRT